MEDVRIAVPGGEINVWHRPAAEESPTVVLVHGLTGTSRWWVPVISHLPDDRGLIARDVPRPAHLLVVDHGMLDQPGGFVPLDIARDAAAGNRHIEVSLHRGLNHYTLMLGDGAPAVARAVSGDR